MTLYRDEETGQVLEKNASIGMAVGGALVLIAGILAGVSILSVIF